MVNRNYNSFESNDLQVRNLSADEAENAAEKIIGKKSATIFSCGCRLTAVIVFVSIVVGAIILV